MNAVSPTSHRADQRLLAFVDDDATEAALRAGLSDSAIAVEVRRGGIKAAIKTLERESRLAWLMVDLGGSEQPLADLDALALVCPPDVNVLAVGTNEDIEFYRALTRDLRVSDYLVKPLSRDRVSRTFAPYLAGTTEASNDRGGRAVLVTGARGGAGASTIAYNLAYQITRQQKSHVVLLDLHLQLGSVASIAGVRVGAGLRTALENPDRIDSLFLERAASPIGDRLKIIAADERLGQPVIMHDAGVSRIIELLRGKFNYVIVDMPIPPPRGVEQLLSQARNVMTVLLPDVLSLRGTQLIRAAFQEAGGGNRMLTVLNRATMQGGLSAKMIEQGLDRPPDISIADFGKAIIGAENAGRPAVETTPAFAQALDPLIHEVTGRGANVERRASLFSRWRTR